MNQIQSQYLNISQKNRNFILTKLPAKVLTKISYAAVRGRDEEIGAIQRVLNTSRISGIKSFTLSGGDFPNAIVLNWVSEENEIVKSLGEIKFNVIANSAQIIDGQHRVAGIKAAIEENNNIGDIEIPVVIYFGLTTKECADIFLAINEEQKPAPRSLVFDLFGLASHSLVDSAAVRARDIALLINGDENSPYFNEIKLPGGKIRKGGIALSTAVVAIKPLVEEKGTFDQIGLVNLEDQNRVIHNFLNVLQNKYEDKWFDKDNVFLWASGFAGAMQFLQLKLIGYCSSKASFSIATISESLKIDRDNLILQSDIKGMSGNKAVSEVYDRLVKSFNPQAVKMEKFEF